MAFLIAAVSLPIVLALSLIIIRVGTTALMLTGLSRETARFQAHSAFTGVGFTTAEAELIMQHPVRRHMIMALMMLGNVGIAITIAVLMIAFQGIPHAKGLTTGLFTLIGSLLAIWGLATSSWVERHLTRLVTAALKKFTHLDVRDYVSLLELSKGFSVSELLVEEGDWLAGKTLAESGLAREGVLVLGIRRHHGEYVGAPSGQSHIVPKDTVVLYGPLNRIRELDSRTADPTGDAAHVVAAEAYDEYLETVTMKDPMHS
jgi:hypothetical protein